jgi:sec-independent protein translocase protein TatA
MGGFGPTEMIILLVIVLVLFGAKKLPDLANSMGRSIKEFRKATEEADADTTTGTASTSDDQEA